MRAVPVAAGRTSASAANATTQKDFRPAMERFYRSAKAFSILLVSGIRCIAAMPPTRIELVHAV